jgi:hypothetical protein
MRRTHKFWGAFFINVGWFMFKSWADSTVKYDGFWAGGAIWDYLVADIHFLIGIRLFTGIPFFKFSDFRRKEKPDAT